LQSSARLRFFARLAVAAVLGLVALACLGGCGSSSGMPHLVITTELGPKPHQWTITAAATGSGRAVGYVFLTYPDGHRSERATFLVWNGITAGAGPEDLASGRYRYSVYAMPTKAQDAPVATASALVQKNIIASGAFTIP
jgi:hypothetical protein